MLTIRQELLKSQLSSLKYFLLLINSLASHGTNRKADRIFFFFPSKCKFIYHGGKMKQTVTANKQN